MQHFSSKECNERPDYSCYESSDHPSLADSFGLSAHIFGMWGFLSIKICYGESEVKDEAEKEKRWSSAKFDREHMKLCREKEKGGQD